MYNRYIPQPDGSFRRNRIQEPHKAPEHVQERAPTQIASPPVIPMPDCRPPTENCAQCPRNHTPHQSAQLKPRPPVQNVGALNFLKHLLPKDFDAEDLLVVLLLLLMTGESKEDQNSALVTLLLYLFL